MSNKRIDLETLDEIAKNAQEMCNHERLLRVNVFAAESVVRELIAELKRCYEEIDWLLVVEDHFTSDGSYNDNANFVYECAVNEKYGYRIEVIDGVETVVHESEY